MLHRMARTLDPALDPLSGSGNQDSSRSRLLPVGAFTAAYLIAALIFALSRGNSEFLFYIAIMVGLMFVVWLVDR